ncbi:phosphorylated adapter RNA export protein isoform X2 [Lethenteron reissneri]|uniref:phosphorylated adapter RNA export protein isoform X2 n=1 Tax=Lethenteron reissneri TaxID=7753 RepID=UPI002AB6121C|nr:phosphorylated adapter RNA export protein isoform X2 [Lethenteron reissneri]
MEVEFEEGELADSDSGSENHGKAPTTNNGSSAQGSNTTNATFDAGAAGGRSCPPLIDTAVRYRATNKGFSSNDSDSDSDDDEERLWRRKRLKNNNQRPPVPMVAQPIPPARGPARPASRPSDNSRKVNNVWGAVLQEQCQDAVAQEIGILGVEADLSIRTRDSESYNYMLAKKIRQKEETQELLKLEAELDGYMHTASKDMQLAEEQCEDLKDEANAQSRVQKRKRRPVKERLGERAEMDFVGRYELKEDDPADRIAEEIAYRLREAKEDLIVRVVSIIGVKKSLELLYETAEIERNGGLMIVNGTRRRTPGGVYLNLMKSTPSVTQEQIKEIFHEENQRDYASKKAALKRRKHLVARSMKRAIQGLDLQDPEDDTSRETFASDTAEAQLAALEDVCGRDVRAPTPQPPPSPATGDSLELDHPNDLELF